MTSPNQDSGLIDLFATHRAAQEAMRTQASEQPSAPPPAVSIDNPFEPVGVRRTLSSVIRGRERFAAVAGGLVMLGILAAIFVGSSSEPAKAVAATAPSATVAPPVVSAPPVEPAPPPAPAAVATPPATSQAAAEPPPKAKGSKRGRKGGGGGGGGGGPKLVKVHSGGVAAAHK